MSYDSLYLIDPRLPVSFNLWWMLKCVVLDKDTRDVTTMASFLATLNRGLLSATHYIVDCVNYQHHYKGTPQLQLIVWLCRVKYLFTQVPSAELHQLQITMDVYTNIRILIVLTETKTQLQVLVMPDLTCVTVKDCWRQATEDSAGKTFESVRIRPPDTTGRLRYQL
jgi:hypothetical protein